jgi:hypothetical protein
MADSLQDSEIVDAIDCMQHDPSWKPNRNEKSQIQQWLSNSSMHSELDVLFIVYSARRMVADNHNVRIFPRGVLHWRTRLSTQPIKVGFGFWVVPTKNLTRADFDEFGASIIQRPHSRTLPSMQIDVLLVSICICRSRLGFGVSSFSRVTPAYIRDAFKDCFDAPATLSQISNVALPSIHGPASPCKTSRVLSSCLAAMENSNSYQMSASLTSASDNNKIASKDQFAVTVEFWCKQMLAHLRVSRKIHIDDNQFYLSLCEDTEMFWRFSDTAS